MEQRRPEDVARLRRLVSRVGFALALVGVAGLIFARDLLFLWAFLIAFGIAEIPRDLWRKWRAHRRQRGGRAGKASP
jgi:hypothetical protein